MAVTACFLMVEVVWPRAILWLHLCIQMWVELFLANSSRNLMDLFVPKLFLGLEKMSKVVAVLVFVVVVFLFSFF